MATVMLELTRPQAAWMDALAVALTRPPGVPERRQSGEEGGEWPPPAARPRRISDDLAWLRQAVDEPEPNGLLELEGTAAVSAWQPLDDDRAVIDRLVRLRQRGVLEAAGFLLHDMQPA